MKNLKQILLSALGAAVLTLAGCGGGGGGAATGLRGPESVVNGGAFRMTLPGVTEIASGRNASKVPSGTASFFVQLYKNYTYDVLSGTQSSHSENALTRSVNITEGSQTITIDGLASGDWSWYIYAVNVSGSYFLTQAYPTTQVTTAYAKGTVIVRPGVITDVPVVMGYGFFGPTSNHNLASAISYTDGDLLTLWSHSSSGAAMVSSTNHSCTMPLVYDGWLGCPVSGGTSYQAGAVQGAISQSATQSQNGTGLGIYRTLLYPTQRLDAVVFGSSSISRTISYGDGQSETLSGSGSLLTHNYSAAGTYTVKVTPSTGEAVETAVTVLDYVPYQPGTAYARTGYGFTNNGSGTLSVTQGDQAQIVVSASGTTISLSFVGTAGATAGLGLHTSSGNTSPTQTGCNSFSSYSSSLTFQAGDFRFGNAPYFCYRNGNTVYAYRVNFVAAAQSSGQIVIPAEVGIRAVSFAASSSQT